VRHERAKNKKKKEIINFNNKLKKKTRDLVGMLLKKCWGTQGNSLEKRDGSHPARKQ